ncbi:MAG: hypothetical protein ABFS19_08155 [Thermodesulfobacteriota bacterium]
MKMWWIPFSKTILSVFFCSLFFSASSAAISGELAELSKEELQTRIAKLEIGLGSYVIGKKLSADQEKTAAKFSGHKTHPGTLKFNDGDTYVIIDKDNSVVIAVYRRNKNAGKDDFKAMVGELMLTYGEPTTMAHGKTMYWWFLEDGLIEQELFESVKAKGQLETIEFLATVKFSSSLDVDTMRTQKEKNKDKKDETTLINDNYVMIQSDVLSKKYLHQ